jgi:hypothetical protein
MDYRLVRRGCLRLARLEPNFSVMQVQHVKDMLDYVKFSKEMVL